MANVSKTSASNKVIVLVIIGILVGVGLVAVSSVYLGQIIPKTVTAPPEVVSLTQTQTQTVSVTVTATQSVVSTTTLSANQIGQVNVPVVKPLPTPTGWNNIWSEALGINLLARYNDSGPAAWSATAHPTVWVTTNGQTAIGGYPGFCLIDAQTQQTIICKQYAIVNQTSYTQVPRFGSVHERTIHLRSHGKFGKAH